MLAYRIPIIVLAFLSGSAASAVDIQLMTEEYPPYNFRSGDEIAGLGAEQVFEVMQRAGLSYEVELTRWSRAIGTAERRPATCVFSTFHTDERDDRFLWVEPLAVDRSLLIKRNDSDIALESLADAQDYAIGTQTGEFTVGILESAGFDQLDLTASMDDALKMLLAGRNDLMAVPEAYFQRIATDGVPVEPALVLSTTNVAIACNLETDPEHVARMQQALDAMITDGTQMEIQNRHTIGSWSFMRTEDSGAVELRVVNCIPGSEQPTQSECQE